MDFLRALRCLVGSTMLVLGCGSSETGDDAGNGGEVCEAEAPGTEFAPCDSDADCFSGFCDETGNPGPYCWASSSAVAQGRGIACASDDDCVVPGEAATTGIKGFCGGSNIAQNYCSFVCKPDAEGSASSAAATTSGGGN